MSKETQETEATEPDPFEAFLGEPGEDPAEEAAAPEGEEPKPEAEPEPGVEEPEPEPEPEAEEEEEVEEEGEGPEPQTLESLEDRNRTLERENRGIRRKMYALREERRLRQEQARVVEEESLEQSIPGLATVDDEGRVVVDRAALQREIDRSAERSTARQAPDPMQAYEAERAAIFAEYPEDQRAGAQEAESEMREAYLWVDAQVGEICKEVGMHPGEIQGLPGVIELAEESGLRDDFEEKYPDLEFSDLITAPTSPQAMRRQLRKRMEQRSSPATGKKTLADVRAEREEKRVVEPERTPRPRSMAKRGRTRSARKSGTVVDADPAAVFSASNDDWNEMEKASIDALEKG